MDVGKQKDIKEVFKELTRKSFKIDAELELPQTDEEDCEMMSVSYYCEDTKKKNRLSRVNVEVELAGIKVNMNMLIDSGSTSSFINPKRLPPDVDWKFYWRS